MTPTSDRIGRFLWSAGALLPLFGRALSMDRACSSRATGLSPLCDSASVNFALSASSALIPALSFDFQLSTFNFRSINSAFSVASVLIPFLPFNFQLSTVNFRSVNSAFAVASALIPFFSVRSLARDSGSGCPAPMPSLLIENCLRGDAGGTKMPAITSLRRIPCYEENGFSGLVRSWSWFCSC